MISPQVNNMETNINIRKKVNNHLTNLTIGYIYFFIAFMLCCLLPKQYYQTGIFYFSIILSTVFFVHLAQNSRIKFGYSIFMTISLFILIFTLGFRNYSGIDDSSYIRTFYNVSQYGWIERFRISKLEPGYLIINKIVSLFTDNYLYMQLLASSIPLVLFYKGLKRYREKINLPMAIFLLITMLYFQMLSASLVRIFIAVSIVFNAYYYIPLGKYKTYVILIILASMFHYSALFMLILLYFVLKKENIKRKSKKFILSVFTLTPIIFIIISKFIVPFLGERHSGYSTISKLSISVSTFDTVPILLLLIFFYKKFKEDDMEYLKLLIVIFSISFVISFYSSMVSVGRLVYYTNAAIFVAAPMISKKLKGTLVGILFDGVIVTYGFVYLYHTQFMLYIGSGILFPYQNIFFNI